MALLFVGVVLLPLMAVSGAGIASGLVLMLLMVGAGLWQRQDWARGGAALVLLAFLLVLGTPDGAREVAASGRAVQGFETQGPDLVSCLAILLGGLLLRLMSHDMRREFALASLDEARRLAHWPLDDSTASR